MPSYIAEFAQNGSTAYNGTVLPVPKPTP